MENLDKEFVRNFLSGNSTESNIIASPIGQFLGAKLVGTNDDELKLNISFTPKPEMINGVDVVQGGQLTSMLDFAMAMAVLNKIKPEQHAATISINTDFLSPAPNEELIAEAEITRMGRSIAFTKAIIKTESGKAIASATANFAIIQ